MRLNLTLRATALAAALTGSGAAADSLQYISKCESVVPSFDNCIYEGYFRTSFHVFPILADHGCEGSRGILNMDRFCVDFGMRRVEFTWKGQERRCMIMSEKLYITCPLKAPNDASDPWISCTSYKYDEVPCAWERYRD